MISKEIEEKIIDSDYQGKSKEINAKINGVSEGTVFNVVKEHERAIGKADREAYRRLAKNADKKNVSFEQIHKCIKINSFLEKNNLGFDDVEKLFPLFSKLQNEKNLPELLENADLLMTIKQTTGQSYDQTVKEHKKKIEELPKLTEQELAKKKIIKDLDVQYETNLKRNNLTADTISRHIRTKANLAKYGVSAEESPQLAARVFNEIELLGYNSRKIVQFLNEAETLNDYAQKARSETRKHEEKRDIAKKSLRGEEETLELAKSLTPEYFSDVKKVMDIQEMGFKTEDLLNVAKNIHKNGFTVDEFVKILDNFETIHSFIDSIIATKESLEEQEESLSLNVDSLEHEKTSLEEINKKLGIEFIEKSTKLKDLFNGLKVTGPLREIYSNSGNPLKVISINVIYLNNLKNWVKTHIPNSNSIVDKIEETIKLFDKVIPRVVA